MNPSNQSSRTSRETPTQLLANKIRTRMKEQYFNKIRNQFLMAQPRNYAITHPSGFPDFKFLTDQFHVSSQSIQQINQVLNQRRQYLRTQKAAIQKQLITNQQFNAILNIVDTNLLKVSLSSLNEHHYIVDLIALFSNILATTDNNKQFCEIVKNKFELNKLIDHILQMMDATNKATGQLLIWLLFSVLRIGPINLTKAVGQIQYQLIESYGTQNKYLLMMLSHLDLDESVHIHEQIIYNIFNKYSNLQSPMNKELSLIMIIILEKYLNHGIQESKIPDIQLYYLNFISNNIQSRNFPPTIKSDLLTLLLQLLGSELSINHLAALIIQRQYTEANMRPLSNLLPELLQRSQYDSLYFNKCMSLFCICQIIKKSPNNLLYQTIERFPSVIDILGDGLSLMEVDLTLQIERVIAKIVVQANNHDSEEEGVGVRMQKKISKMINSSSIPREIGALINHPCHQISNLAQVLCSEYLQI